MAMTTFPFNAEAPIFIPTEERDAAIALASLRRDDANLEAAIQGLMALNLGENNENNENNEDNNDNELNPDPDAEYTDAWQEYAISNGLWGLPGSGYEPSEEEIEAMRREFDEQWYNIPYEVFMPENEEQEQEPENTQSDDAPQIQNANTRYEQFDPNVMFVPCCAECGVEAGENVMLYGCNYDEELYCTGCWDAYRNGNGEEDAPEDPATWSEIAVDFQDYTDDWDLNPDRPTADRDYYEAWESYLETCWHPLSRNYVENLGEANNWVGVRPGAEPPSIDGGDQC